MTEQQNGRGEEVNFEGVIGWVYLKHWKYGLHPFPCCW